MSIMKTATGMGEAGVADGDGDGEGVGYEMEPEAETVDERPPAPAVPAPTAKKGPVVLKKERKAGDAPAPVSSPLRSVQHAEEVELRDWLLEFGGAGDIKVLVERREPEMYKGIKTNGVLRTYHEPIDVETVRQNHGGGTYCIRLMRRNKGLTTGKFVFEGGSKTFHIPGVPRLDNLKNEQEEAAAAADLASGTPHREREPENAGVIGRAFDAMAQQQRILLERQMMPQPTPDLTAAIAAAVAPFQMMVEQQQRQIDRMMTAQATPAAETQSQKAENKLLDKLIDGDSARITSLTAKFESEIRTVKENAREDQKRAQDAWERERDRMVSDHNRALDMAKQQADITMQAVKMNLEGQNGFLQREITRLERELSEVKKEVTELRAKKDKSPFELATEVEKLREVFGGEDEKEKTSGIERIASKVIDSPIVQGIAEKVMQGMGNQEAQQQQQMPQVGRPFRGPDGAIYVNNGQAIVPYRPNKKKKRAQPAEAPTGGEATPEEATEEGVEEASEEEVPQFEEADIKIVVGFLEAAYGRGTEPETVANGFRTQVPGNVITYIARHGVDPFLDQVAHLPKSSPLATQGGRNWVRKLGRALVPTDQ